MPSAAERQKRYRQHLKGDHSLCDPERGCESAPEAPTGRSVPPQVRTERGPRGQELWDGLSTGLPPAQRVLLDEACRIADRLDQLDHMLTDRDTWLSLITSEAGDIRLVIDGLLSETRQQATAMRGLLAEVVKAAPKAQGRTGGASGAPTSTKGAANVSSLAARAARRRATTG